MILQSSAVLQLMSALLDVGPEGATREHLVHKADIGTTTFYRAIKPLLQRGLVTEQGNRYVLPLTHPYNFRFKLWCDMEKLYDLDDQVRNEVLDIAQRAGQELGESLSALWLVGSAAHGTMNADSDLDFLAVVRKQTLYHPRGTRPINFVTMTEAEFRNKYAVRDDFVLTALRYGRLLRDSGFAQEFYEHAMPRTLPARQAQAKEGALERHRDNFLFFLRSKESEEARKALRSHAVSLARMMAQCFGELPRGKEDLIELSGQLFGKRFVRCLQRAVEQKGTAKSMMELSRQLLTYQQRFHENLSHLKTFAPLTHAGGVEFEQLTATIMQELFADGERLEQGGHEGKDFDLSIRTSDGSMLVVACKTRERGLEADALQPLTALRKTMGRKEHDRLYLVLLANTFRSLPLLERPAPFSQNLQQTASESMVRLLSGAELLRAHNVLHLEELTAAAVAKDLTAT